MWLNNETKMRNHLAEEVRDSDMLNLILTYKQHLGNNAVNGAIAAIVGFVRNPDLACDLANVCFSANAAVVFFGCL